MQILETARLIVARVFQVILGPAALGIVFSLAIALAGCSAAGAGMPPVAVVERALGLQALLTQAALSPAAISGHLPTVDDLDWPDQAPGQPLPFSPLHWEKLQIEGRSPVVVDQLPAVAVRGHYDLVGAGGDRRRFPFEVILQRQRRGQTWRLAKRQPSADGAAPRWSTYRLQ